MVDDLGRRAILDPLVETLRPATVLICWIDQEPESESTLPGVATVDSCTAAELPAALQRGLGTELIWLRGYPTWHSVRALTETIGSHIGASGSVAPVVMVECGPEDAAPFERVESTKDGARAALDDAGSAIDPDATVLWCSTGRGFGAWIPGATATQLKPWIDQCRMVLDALRAEHGKRVALDARNFALFELLDQSQRDGTAVVRSSRFRLGTRAVRLARTVTRKEAVFRPPGAILARQRSVDEWRARLAGERRHERPTLEGALRVTYVLPELRMSGGALVVMQLANELRQLGVDARVAALRGRRDRRREVFRWRVQINPTVFADEGTLVQRLPATDVVVATHWTTAAWVEKLVKAGRAPRAAYFVQDYEPWFYADAEIESRRGSSRPTA